jgi:hypothetical protein
MRLDASGLEYSMECPGERYEHVADVMTDGILVYRAWRYVSEPTTAMCVLCGEPYVWETPNDRCVCDVP